MRLAKWTVLGLLVAAACGRGTPLPLRSNAQPTDPGRDGGGQPDISLPPPPLDSGVFDAAIIDSGLGVCQPFGRDFALDIVGRFESDGRGRIARIVEFGAAITLVNQGGSPFTIAYRGPDISAPFSLGEEVLVFVQREPDGGDDDVTVLIAPLDTGIPTVVLFESANEETLDTLGVWTDEPCEPVEVVRNCPLAVAQRLELVGVDGPHRNHPPRRRTRSGHRPHRHCGCLPLRRPILPRRGSDPPRRLHRRR